ncbi:unnamed protein product [Brassica rapa]|uniref:Uncharacterized protein n=3 Tax=Brassica TaxID=3705 RepID=A0A8D9DHF0_BRACM|nr:unnamed protein product [Brassica napus]CAG7877340.1 unnamed protein product [Brassica rapa]
MAEICSSTATRDPLPLIAAAKKKNKRDDNHSFSTRLDEATGPFPESILLKEKKIDESSDLLPDFDDAEEKELYEFLDLQLQSDLDEERSNFFFFKPLLFQV